MKYIFVLVTAITTFSVPNACAAQRVTASTESVLFGLNSQSVAEKGSVLEAYVRTALENNQGLRASFDEWQVQTPLQFDDFLGVTGNIGRLTPIGS